MYYFYATIVGFSYYDSGRNEDSLNFYDKALKLDLKISMPTTTKASLFLASKETKNQYQCYEEALRIDPNAIKVLFNKGVSLSRLGR